MFGKINAIYLFNKKNPKKVTLIYTILALMFIMMGTLVAVAEGKISPEEIPDIIEAKNRARAGMTAPADGLYLNRVEY